LSILPSRIVYITSYVEVSIPENIPWIAIKFDIEYLQSRTPGELHCA